MIKSQIGVFFDVAESCLTFQIMHKGKSIYLTYSYHKTTNIAHWICEFHFNYLIFKNTSIVFQQAEKWLYPIIHI